MLEVAIGEDLGVPGALTSEAGVVPSWAGEVEHRCWCTLLSGVAEGEEGAVLLASSESVIGGGGLTAEGEA